MHAEHAVPKTGKVCVVDGYHFEATFKGSGACHSEVTTVLIYEGFWERAH